MRNKLYNNSADLLLPQGSHLVRRCVRPKISIMVLKWSIAAFVTRVQQLKLNISTILVPHEKCDKFNIYHVQIYKPVSAWKSRNPSNTEVALRRRLCRPTIRRNIFWNKTVSHRQLHKLTYYSKSLTTTSCPIFN